MEHKASTLRFAALAAVCEAAPQEVTAQILSYASAYAPIPEPRELDPEVQN